MKVHQQIKDESAPMKNRLKCTYEELNANHKLIPTVSADIYDIDNISNSLCYRERGCRVMVAVDHQLPRSSNNLPTETQVRVEEY